MQPSDEIQHTYAVQIFNQTDETGVNWTVFILQSFNACYYYHTKKKKTVQFNKWTVSTCILEYYSQQNNN